MFRLTPLDILSGRLTTLRSVAIITTLSYCWRAQEILRILWIQSGMCTIRDQIRLSASSSIMSAPQAIRGICTVMRCEFAFPDSSFLGQTDVSSRQVLASGSGSWDGTIVNPSNPQRRDTHLLVGGGYLVCLLRVLCPCFVRDNC